MKTSIWITVVAIAIVAPGCMSKPKHEFAGAWHAYSPWCEPDGGVMTFDGSSFHLSGRISSGDRASVDISGSYSASPNAIHLVVQSVDYSDLDKTDSITKKLAADDKDELLQAKNLDLKVTWVTDNIVTLQSGPKGPGPEGEVNFVLQRNGESAMSKFGSVGTSIEWLPSYHFVHASDTKPDATVQVTPQGEAAIKRATAQNQPPTQPDSDGGTSANPNPNPDTNANSNPNSQSQDQGQEAGSADSGTASNPPQTPDNQPANPAPGQDAPNTPPPSGP